MPLLGFKWIGLPIGIIAAAALFENFRHVVLKPFRHKSLLDFWEPLENEQQQIEYINFLDYLLFPVTMSLGWLTMPIDPTRWKQKAYNSLIVAGRFVNPFIEWQDRNITDLFSFLMYRLTRTNRNGIPSEEVLQQTMPVQEPNFKLLFDYSNMDLDTVYETFNDGEGFMTCTWIGQSTCFVQMQGLNILTDPIFSATTIGEYLGVKRLRPVPCTLNELPKIDIVIVSHNHYDHLDMSVVLELKNSCTWFVPNGMASWFFHYGITNVVELDWWQSSNFKNDRGEVEIIATPTQHWSGRHFFDVNATLWCSFLVKAKSCSFFHCGDSGYCSVFKEIGNIYGPITFACLPIGSYEPRYYLCHQHMNPNEAALVTIDMNIKTSLGVHWGTFMMSDEHYLDPPKDFEKARIENNLPEESLITRNIGSTIIIPFSNLNSSWIMTQ